MEISVKVGSKKPDINDPNHATAWRDCQIISMRPSGYYRSKYARMHHCVIELPQIDYWALRGTTDWKSNQKSVLNLKKYLCVPDESGKFEWEVNNFWEHNKKDRSRDYLIDFKWLVQERYITENQRQDIYNKDISAKIVLPNVFDFTELFKHEDDWTRLDAQMDASRGSISSGTHSIGSGLDYDDVELFEADIIDLTGDLTGEHNAEETTISTQVVFDIDTDTYTLAITAENGDEHSGVWSTSKARINCGTSDRLEFDEAAAGTLGKIHVSKLQFDVDGFGNSGVYIEDASGTGDKIVERCIVRGGSGGSQYGLVAYYEAPTGIQYRNNIIYDCTTAGISFTDRWAACDYKFYNNTIIACGNGINQAATQSNGSSTIQIKNNLCQDNTNGFATAGGSYGTTSKNVTEDATSPDDGIYDNLNCHDGNSCFTDYSGDDFTLDSGGDEISTLDDGDDLSGTFTDDVAGTTRSTWYIGAYEIPSAGTTHELAGTIAGSASLTGVLNLKNSLGGTIAGQSVPSGELNLKQSMQGQIDGQSALVGGLNLKNSLQGQIDGQSAFSVNLNLINSLQGQIDGQSGFIGLLNLIQRLSGTIEGQSALTGTLQLINALQGAIAATSNFQGSLSLVQSMGGEIAGASNITGFLNVILSLSGLIGAQSGFVGDLTVTSPTGTIHYLSGTIAGSSGMAGTLNLKQSLGGEVSGSSDLSGNLNLKQVLAGQIAGSADLTGNLNLKIALEGLVEAVSSFVGELSVISEEDALDLIEYILYICQSKNLTAYVEKEKDLTAYVEKTKNFDVEL